MNRMSPSLRILKGSCQLSIRQERGSEASVTHIQLVLPSAKAVKDMSSRVSIFDGATS
jgi:hypothetical protein